MKIFIAIWMSIIMFAASAEAEELDVIGRYEELLLERGPLRFWSVEDRAIFYEEIVANNAPESITDMALQSFLEHVHAIPDTTCVSENEALLCAQMYLIENKGITEAEVEALSHYTYFYNDDVVNPIYEFRFFKSKTGKEMYAVQVNAKTSEVVNVNNDIAEKKKTAEEYYETLLKEKGNYRFWTLEEKAVLAQLQIEAGNLPEYFLDGIPSADDITEKSAISLAQNALHTQMMLDTEKILKYEVYTSFNVLNRQSPEWHVAFHEPGMGIERYYIIIDSKTGSILSIREGING